jgi:hypothetical protein
MDEDLKRFEDFACEIRRLYCVLRLRRKTRFFPVGGSRRSLYRQIEQEKARLIGLGYSVDLVRRYCYVLANPRLDNPYLIARMSRFISSFAAWYADVK